MKLIKLVLKKTLTELRSVKFWIAAAVVSALCLCANMEGMDAGAEAAVYNLILHCSRQELVNKGELYSSYGVLMAFRSSYWFPIIVPVVAAVPFINRFGDEWLTGYYYMRMPRSKRAAYAAEAVLTAASAGFLVMSFGILFYGAACMCFFPSYSSFGLEPGESIIAAVYGQTAGARLASFIKVLVHAGLIGSIASTVSLICLTIVKDCFMSITLPMMLVYLSTKVCNYYTLFIRENYEGDPPAAVDMVSLLIPSMYMDIDGAFARWFGAPYALWYIYLLALEGVLALAVVLIVRRRNV